MRRTVGFFRFLFLFLIEFIKANLEVARLVLFVPRRRFRDGFVDYSIKDMTFREALLLSHCITLTPGTITAQFDWENRNLQIHVLNYSNPEATRKEIDQKLKKIIWGFSR